MRCIFHEGFCCKWIHPPPHLIWVVLRTISSACLEVWAIWDMLSRSMMVQWNLSGTTPSGKTIFQFLKISINHWLSCKLNLSGMTTFSWHLGWSFQTGFTVSPCQTKHWWWGSIVIVKWFIHSKNNKQSYAKIYSVKADQWYQQFQWRVLQLAISICNKEMVGLQAVYILTNSGQLWSSVLPSPAFTLNSTQSFNCFPLKILGRMDYMHINKISPQGRTYTPIAVIPKLTPVIPQWIVLTQDMCLYQGSSWQLQWPQKWPQKD